jgi:hypothetical protein
MPKICRNTGDPIQQPCGNTNCIYFNASKRLNCIVDEWNDAAELFKLMKQNPIDLKKLTKDAEAKISVWGKVVNNLDTLHARSFKDFVLKVYGRDEELAVSITENVHVYLAAPMMYLKSTLWVSVVNKYGSELVDCGIASPVNATTWTRLRNLNLL